MKQFGLLYIIFFGFLFGCSKPEAKLEKLTNYVNSDVNSRKDLCEIYEIILKNINNHMKYIQRSYQIYELRI